MDELNKQEEKVEQPTPAVNTAGAAQTEKEAKMDSQGQVVFGKRGLIASSLFSKAEKLIAETVLEDEKFYTIEEAEKKIKDFEGGF